ncbi:MAG: GNAT family N-acetyltransferase [Acidimicrobiales bacterium]|nr:GNAT family N-acetyltransferase [Acidimicrobiales bacterium]
MTVGSFTLQTFVGDRPLCTREADRVGVADGPALQHLAERDLLASDAAPRIAAGDVALVAWHEDAPVGVFWLCPTAHRDPHFGSASKPSPLGMYGHQLLVDPAARGLGLGRELLVAARQYAAEAGQVVHTMVDPTNRPSVIAHERAGYRPAHLVRGIRFGPLTIRRPQPALVLPRGRLSTAIGGH